MNMPEEFSAIVSAPGFSLGIRCTDSEVTGIEFIEPHPEFTAHSAMAKEAVRQVRSWLIDSRFTFSLPLAAAGTPFQRRVWAGISAIPPGETRRYGELAADIGSSPRAVGNACGANPYPVVVPCHRVVAAGGVNGGLGGFARQRGGFLLDVKRWLLRHEH